MLKTKNSKIIVMVIILAVAITLIPSMNFMCKSHNYKKYYEEGVRNLNGEKFDEAIESFNTSLKYNKKYTADINKKIELAKCLKQSKDVYMAATKLTVEKNYIEAINFFQKITPDDVKRYKEAQNKIGECKKIYVDQNIENAKVEAKSGNYKSAIAIIDNILKSFKDDKISLALKDEYIKFLQKSTEENKTEAPSGQPSSQTVVSNNTVNSTQSNTNLSGIKGWDEVVRGDNSPNNISNENFAVKQGDWIYYFALRENVLYKVKVDGTNKTKILNADILSMVVKDNFIYFINSGDNARIYRVGTDGSGCQSLNHAYGPNTDCSSLNISGNWLCYIDFRMNSMTMLSLDGSQFKQIHNHAFMPRYLYVWGDEVYGVNERAGDSIYKVNLGEADGGVITSDESGYVNLSNGDVFYSNRSDGEKLYKITNSGAKVKLNDDKSWWINVYGDWAYYSNASDENKLYKVRKDGSGRSKLNNEFTCHINIIGDWIFYAANDGTYMIKTDGSHRIKL
jgi:tetratricopeptide (TPR) repeat protein